jgi:hypothetical protein
MDDQTIVSNAVSATHDFCECLNNIPFDIIRRLGENKIMILNYIHIMYTIQELLALIHGSDLIKSNLVSQKNVSDLFHHFIELGMTPLHSCFSEDESNPNDFVFTREGMKFLNDNVKPFEELINIYLTALDITI